MTLWAAVGAVFVLGCVNIGGMLLARSTGRVGEIATRLALGAPLRRIGRALLVGAEHAGSRYTSRKMNQYYDTVGARLHEIPGIDGAAVSLNLPYERGLNMGVRLA